MWRELTRRQQWDGCLRMHVGRQLCSRRYYQDRELRVRVQVMGPRCTSLVQGKRRGYVQKSVYFFGKGYVFPYNHQTTHFNLSMHLAHHDLYEKAGILHFDISINNLMVDPSDPSPGILSDLDMAARDNDPESVLKLERPPPPPARSLP